VVVAQVAMATARMITATIIAQVTQVASIMQAGKMRGECTAAPLGRQIVMTVLIAMVTLMIILLRRRP
jgi:hypothetical protein